jgi:hypothetical protein
MPNKHNGIGITLVMEMRIAVICRLKARFESKKSRLQSIVHKGASSMRLLLEWHVKYTF